jgi:TldD protein
VSFPAGVYADARVEHEVRSVVGWRDGDLVEAGRHERLGAHVRVRRGGRWLAAATTDLAALSARLADLARGGVGGATGGASPDLPLETHRGDHRRIDAASDLARVPLLEKRGALERCLRPLGRSDVTSWAATYDDRRVEKRFLSSLGADLRHDVQEAGLVFRFAVAHGTRSVRERFGCGAVALGGLDGADAALARHLERCAAFAREAQPVRPGRYPVVLSPEAAGVFAHEAVGHRSEADLLLGDAALGAGWRLGDRVAPAGLSVIDGGGVEGSGYTPWDDEGQPAGETWLVREGVLAGRLHSASTAAALGGRCTGNSRALDFRCEPLVRMTTTWIAAGDRQPEELFAGVADGYFVETVRHGSGMQTFTMAPGLAWRIENGRVTSPARIAVASGDVLATLAAIDGVSNRVEIPWRPGGGCHKLDQGPLPVGAGGPFVRVRALDLA